MNRQLRRLLYVAAVLAWLLVMALPVFAFVLVNRGQIEIGSQPGRTIRVFLLQEPDVEGIGIEWERPLVDAGPNCTRTSVRYLLWEGAAEQQAVSYCQCHDPETGFAVGLPNCQPQQPS